ncbi:probable serine/threonine-protein kinase yakA [Ruditapes philippinarum]|uniref:probable serine/threonine-protein kinase yakA n=1 Tax=Ruditapes philippinarum TaxID=129788 RepID=UPI00295C3A40|nr:probable serine/threonine-protein kinase yakA [Ruditapes philippinarum]
MNKFKVLDPKPIDEGPSFRTLLAKNLKRDEKVAMKILKKNYYSLEECKRHKEVQVTQALDHKNVQKMMELMNDSNELIMVLEYVPDNVKGVMKKKGGPFTEMETKTVMLQVFLGLSHLHEMGFIHRNLRPEVILCDKELTTVKISDFSMTKSDQDQLGEYDVIPVWHQSPEVLLRASTYTNKIDCWAAGCIMAELLLGETLMPGTSNSDQMKLICELIGIFSPRHWTEGAKLRRLLQYRLPDVQGKGLSGAGLQAGSDAKGLIMNCLEWNPDIRTSAKEAIRHEFFKSDGEFKNTNEYQETMKGIGLELSSWKKKWESDLSKGPSMELDNILDKLYQKPQHKDRNSNRQKFTGFETSNPLIGFSTPRDKKFQQMQQQQQQQQHQQQYSQQQYPQQQQQQQRQLHQHQQQEHGNGYDQTRDDPFQFQQSNGISHQARTYPLDTQYPDKAAEKSQFEENFSPREEKQSRQSISGEDPYVAQDAQMSSRQYQDPIFSTDGHMSPPRQRRNNESPRRKQKDQIGLLGGDLDDAQIEREQREKRRRAEHLKNTNSVKYNTIYGKGIFGDVDQPKFGGTPTRSRRANNDAGKSDDQKQPIRTRQQNDDGLNMTNGFGPTSDNTQMNARNQPRLKRMDTFERIAAIDHTKRSEQLRQQNPVKQRDKYGDPFMSQLLGQKMPPKQPPQTSQSQSNFGGYGDNGEFGGSGKYTPSWSADKQMRTH